MLSRTALLFLLPLLIATASFAQPGSVDRKDTTLVCFSLNEADVVLDSLQMGKSWYDAWRLQRVLLAVETSNGKSLERELNSERSARKKSDDLFVDTDFKLDRCEAENATLRMRVGGRFWLGVGLGGAAVAGTLLLLK